LRKGLVFYFKSNSIIALRKNTLDVNHGLIAKDFEEEVNNVIKRPMEKNLVVNGNVTSNFLGP
jgi:L-cysteine desulfidase